MKDTMSAYLHALEAGDFSNLMELFAGDAVVRSPLYGEKPAGDFYRELFRDTEKSILTPLHYFYDEDENAGALHFLYEWVLEKHSRHASFECVDVMEFDERGKIKRLTIIYDTAQTRAAFMEQKYG